MRMQEKEKKIACNFIDYIISKIKTENPKDIGEALFLLKQFKRCINNDINLINVKDFLIKNKKGE